MESQYRDDFTGSIQSEHGRKIFFGDETFDDVPEELKEKVALELYSLDLEYLIPDDICKKYNLKEKEL